MPYENDGLMKWCLLSPPRHIPDQISVELPVSKSLYNRLLIIKALAADSIPLKSGPRPSDSIFLERALDQVKSGATTIKTGPGGTTFRFLLAYLAIAGYEGTVQASGSMLHRPVEPLIDALNALGANIRYVGAKHGPSIIMSKSKLVGKRVKIDGSISSQFISALLMIGPYLPEGLELQIQKAIVSGSYIQMTIQLMRQFGIQVQQNGDRLFVSQGAYRWPSQKQIQVESDWTGASYFWMHSHALGIQEMHLKGLHSKSLQGDALLADWVKQQGGDSFFSDQGWTFTHTKATSPFFGHEFEGLRIPDLAMSHISLYAFFGYSISYSGLTTLFQKESNRIDALQREWAKWGASLSSDSEGRIHLAPSHKKMNTEWPLLFHTYEDHRIAMCLSVLASRGEIWIENPEVVEKSFPNFWQELEKLGYRIEFNTSPKF